MLCPGNLLTETAVHQRIPIYWYAHSHLLLRSLPLTLTLTPTYSYTHSCLLLRSLPLTLMLTPTYSYAHSCLLLRSLPLTLTPACSIDIVAKYKGRTIAIEVDGPFHFMVNM